MRRYLLYGLAAAILFVVPASISLWLKNRNAEETGKVGNARPSKNDGADAKETRLSKPEKPNAEGTTALTNLRDREKAVSEKEEAVNQRQKKLDLIRYDIQKEQAELDELHRQIQEELRAASQKPFVAKAPW